MGRLTSRKATSLAQARSCLVCSSGFLRRPLWRTSKFRAQNPDRVKDLRRGRREASSGEGENSRDMAPRFFMAGRCTRLVDESLRGNDAEPPLNGPPCVDYGK